MNECTLHPRKDMNFRGRQSVVDQNVSLQESYIEALTLDVMIFGDGALREILGFDDVMRVMPS